MKMLVSVLGSLIAVGVAAADLVVSVNIATGDADKMSSQSGADNSLAGDNVPCSSWYDVSAVSGSVTGLPVWDGTETKTSPIDLDWGIKGIWGTGSSKGVFRRGWITATGTGAWTMTFSNIPFASYDVICYCNWDGSHGFSPISVNGTNWTYKDGKTVIGTDYWGVTTTDKDADAKLGDNAIRVPNQSGSTLEVGSSGYGNVCAIQIVGKMADISGADVLSVNFVDTGRAADSSRVLQDGTALAGLADVAIEARSWNNLEPMTDVTSGESSVKLWNSSDKTVIEAGASGVRVAWNNPDHTYFSEKNPSPEDKFLRGYLADRGSEAPSVTVTGIPWEKYDLIVYLSADFGGGAYDWSWESAPDFNPVEVNGTKYTWSGLSTVVGDGFWGTYNQSAAAFGVNALKIGGLSESSLTLSAGRLRQSGSDWITRRGGIAAFQIVKAAFEVVRIESAVDLSTADINKYDVADKLVELTFSAAAAKLTLTSGAALDCRKLMVVSEGDVMLSAGNGQAIAASEGDKLELSRVGGRILRDWAPNVRMVSLNVDSPRGAMSGSTRQIGALSGWALPLTAANAWTEMAEGLEDSQSVVVWEGAQGLAATNNAITVSWKAKGIYGIGSSPDYFRRGWFNASGAGEWSMEIAGLPFSSYDVVCYLNSDAEHSSGFTAVGIGGNYWKWDSAQGKAVTGRSSDYWGATKCDLNESAALGQNAMLVTGQSGTPLRIYGATWANLCAAQIIERPANGMLSVEGDATALGGAISPAAGSYEKQPGDVIHVGGPAGSICRVYTYNAAVGDFLLSSELKFVTGTESPSVTFGPTCTKLVWTKKRAGVIVIFN